MSTKVLKGGPIRAANNYRRAEVEFLRINKRLTLREGNDDSPVGSEFSCYGATFQIEVPDDYAASASHVRVGHAATGIPTIPLPPSFGENSTKGLNVLKKEASGRVSYTVIAALAFEGSSSLGGYVENVTQSIRIRNEAWRIEFLDACSGTTECRSLTGELWSSVLRPIHYRSWTGVSIVQDMAETIPTPALTPNADGGYSGKVVLAVTMDELMNDSLPCLARVTGEICAHTAYRTETVACVDANTGRNCSSGQVVTSEIQARIDHIDFSPWRQSPGETGEQQSTWTIEWSTPSGPLPESFYAVLISRWYELHLKLWKHSSLFSRAETLKLVIPLKIGSISTEVCRPRSAAHCRQLDSLAHPTSTELGLSQEPPRYTSGV